MSKLDSKLYKKISFKRTKFKECADELVNPDCGWYQIHTFKLGTDLRLEDSEFSLNATDTIALVLVDISNYRDRDLDDEALGQLREIFSLFADYHIGMIVRIVYDNEGKCLETEPSTEDLVLAHMARIAPVLKEFNEDILVYQGLLIGNWGEMHSSKFLSPRRLKRLADDFVKALQEDVFLAVRRPAYVRILFPEGEDLKQTQVGIFDDAILASVTHLGTFGEKPAKEVRREQSWLPKEEIEYVSQLCDRVPYGGEALWTDEPDALTPVRNDLRKMSDYFAKLHITYLNRVHDARFIEHLKEMKYKGRGIFHGMDGYSYMSRHLGYRFIITDVRCETVESDRSIVRWDITIKNVGFARSFFRNSCRMIAQDEYGDSYELNFDKWIVLNQIPAGASHTFVCMTEPVNGDVYLRFGKAKTAEPVYFANKNKKGKGDGADIFLGTASLK